MDDSIRNRFRTARRDEPSADQAASQQIPIVRMPKRPLSNVRAKQLRPVYERPHAVKPVAPEPVEPVAPVEIPVNRLEQPPVVPFGVDEPLVETAKPVQKPVEQLRPVYERPKSFNQLAPQPAPVEQPPAPVPIEIPDELRADPAPVAPVIPVESAPAAPAPVAMAPVATTAAPAVAAADETPELEWLRKPAQEDDSHLVLEHEPNFFKQALAVAQREIPRKVWIIGGVVAGLLLVTFGVKTVLYHSSNLAAAVHLPSSVTSTLNFDYYYPKAVPLGYTYMPGSAKNLAGELQFRLQRGNATITVTEQPMPNGQAGTLGKMPGAAVLSLIQGQARINVDSFGTPEGLLITKNARINVLSNGTATSGDITTVIENLWQK